MITFRLAEPATVPSYSTDLIQRCIAGERRAQHELYRQSYSFLMSVCYRYSGEKDQAEEWLNLGFMKILTNIHRRSANVPIELWMRRIQINIIIDEWRKSKRNHAIEYRDEIFSSDETESEIVFNNAQLQMEAAEVQAMIDQLPNVSKQVFNLFAIDGFSHKEIGKMLHISEGTSKWHLNFARTRLKQELTEFSKTSIIKA